MACWICLAWPIIRVTRSAQTVRAAQRPDRDTVMTWVTLRFSEAPSYFELLQDGRVLWREDPAGGTVFEHSFPVFIDEFGAEFVFKSRIRSPGAIEITIEPDERRARSQTLWVDGEVYERLTFSWSRDDGS